MLCPFCGTRPISKFAAIFFAGYATYSCKSCAHSAKLPASLCRALRGATAGQRNIQRRLEATAAARVLAALPVENMFNC